MVVIDELLILELDRKWARSLCARYNLFLFTKSDPIIALHAHLTIALTRRVAISYLVPSLSYCS